MRFRTLITFHFSFFNNLSFTIKLKTTWQCLNLVIHMPLGWSKHKFVIFWWSIPFYRPCLFFYFYFNLSFHMIGTTKTPISSHTLLVSCNLHGSKKVKTTWGISHVWNIFVSYEVGPFLKLVQFRGVHTTRLKWPYLI